MPKRAIVMVIFKNLIEELEPILIAQFLLKMTMNVHWAVTIAPNHLNAAIRKAHSGVKNQGLQRPPQRQLQQQRRLQLNVHTFTRSIMHRSQHTHNRTAIDTLLGLIQLPILETLNMISDTVHATLDSKEVAMALAWVSTTNDIQIVRIAEKLPFTFQQKNYSHTRYGRMFAKQSM